MTLRKPFGPSRCGPALGSGGAEVGSVPAARGSQRVWASRSIPDRLVTPSERGRTTGEPLLDGLERGGEIDVGEGPSHDCGSKPGKRGLYRALSKGMGQRQLSGFTTSFFSPDPHKTLPFHSEQIRLRAPIPAVRRSAASVSSPRGPAGADKATEVAPNPSDMRITLEPCLPRSRRTSPRNP
jgi:hypothetical protein